MTLHAPDADVGILQFEQLAPIIIITINLSMSLEQKREFVSIPVWSLIIHHKIKVFYVYFNLFLFL